VARPDPPDVRLLARRYTRAALKTLAEIMERGTSEQARIAAADKLLDRAHGRVRSESEGSGGKTLLQLLEGESGEGDDAS
jgi:hypothetical protein